MQEGAILSDKSWQETSQTAKPRSPKPRAMRVVNIGKRGPDGQVSMSPPRKQALRQALENATGQSPMQAWDSPQPASPSDEAVASPTSSDPPKKNHHNLFGVGYNESSWRPAEPLLPYVPRRAQDVCKTYSHIFKLLNDPSLKKRVGMPEKKKSSVHVLPRVSPDSMAVAEELGPLRMAKSRSSPGMVMATGMTSTSTTASDVPLWSQSMRADAEGERVRLPPLAKSR
jgi:hypothetical protein